MKATGAELIMRLLERQGITIAARPVVPPCASGRPAPARPTC